MEKGKIGRRGLLILLAGGVVDGVGLALSSLCGVLAWFVRFDCECTAEERDGGGG